MSRRLIHLAAVFFLGACLPLPSLLAQDSQDKGSDDEPLAVEEEVFVVGSKTDVSRQELEASVGYFAEERIRDDVITSIEDIFDRTANVFTGTAAIGAYSIRGVNNNGVSGSLNNSNALATVFYNQTALGLTSADYIKPSMFDVSSVEVLRGPQSSIQGPNSLIGAIFINATPAQFNRSNGRLLLEAGELGTLRVGVVQNLDLASDVFALRLIAETRQTDGDVTNITTGRDDVQRVDDQTYRMQGRFRPASRDDLFFDATLMRVDSDSNAFGLVVPQPGSDLFDRIQIYNVDDEYPSDLNLGNLLIDWQISDSWQFTSVTSVSDFGLDQAFDGDLTQFDFLSVVGFAEESLINQDFRLQFGGERVNALIGAYYSDAEYGAGFAGSGLFPDGMGGSMPISTATDNVEEIEQQALFGRVNWSITDSLTATVGVRLNREERTSINFADNNGFVSDLAASESFDQVIPNAALNYAISETTSIGASYGRGFQAGGIAFAVFLGQSAPYDEEFTDNFEVFVRHRTRGGKVTLNANAFAIDWTDQQVVATVPGGFPGFDDLIVNAGESSIQGGEIEFEWRPITPLSIFASVGLVDSEFEQFVLNGVDLAGQEFQQSPDYNISLGATFQARNGWFGGSTLSLVDDSYTEIAAPEITAVSERTLLSGRLGYGGDRWRAYVWGRNLLDDEYEVSLFDGRTFGFPGGYGRVGEPRTLGAGFEFNW
ncbi:MAG: TonB-dependent receptor [Acidobacteriota bacterium]